MRGSPLVRAAVMVAVLLALLVPLHRLTTARAAAAVMAAPVAPISARVHLRIFATAVPFTFSVSHLGKVIWRGESATSPVETDVSLPFPKEGIDLALDAKWMSGGTAAVKLSVARGDEDAGAQTAWGDGSVSEVFTFQ